MDLIERLRWRNSYGSVQVDEALVLKAADEIERLRKNLNSRDDFIGAHGLWDKFVQSLPKK